LPWRGLFYDWQLLDPSAGAYRGIAIPGTRLRPNHLTTGRLLSGLAACVCFGFGTKSGMAWGGGLWLLSAFLDRADGELARIGNMSRPPRSCL